MIPVRPASLLAALCVSMLPAGLQAQFAQGGPRGADTGWAPAGVGIRVGFDNAQSRPMVGAMARIPVVPSGSIEILSNGDVTFLPRLKQYQLNLELVYLLSGRRGGLYGGGGIGVRNSVFGPDPTADPRNERTFSVVAGIRFGGLGRIRPELETRWILLDEPTRDPSVVNFGATITLW